MVSPHTPTSSNSSALFGSDDSSFLEALAGSVLPGDFTPKAGNSKAAVLSKTSPIPVEPSSSLEPPPCAQPRSNAHSYISSGDEKDTPSITTSSNAQTCLKHPPIVLSGDDEPSLLQLGSPTPAQSRYKKRAYSVSSCDEHPALPHSSPESPIQIGTSYLDSDTYEASRFGGFGDYMRRKRAKLQIQNAEMGDSPEVITSNSRLFNGLAIHINGWTEPSVQELRKMIVEHGGVYRAYIDKKTLVTHIITCSLTPAKVREFKQMKVVRPEWLVQSVKAGVLLPWQDFIFVAGGRVESAHGRLAQMPLTEFAIDKQSTSTTQGVGLENPESPDRSDKFASTPTSLPSSPQAPSTLFLPSVPQVPKYAEHESNPAARRAMADPAWRAAHTSMAPDFIAGYYANSRLHHLSTWKAELRILVAEARERAERGDVDVIHRTSESEAGTCMRNVALVMKNPLKGKEKADNKKEKVIMHVDFDAFFVSAGLIGRPHLRGQPAVVCHSQRAQGGGSSTSEIASASYEARRFGIKNGMSLQQAQKLCPDLVTIPYEFETYRQLSLEFYTVLMSCADDLQAVSVDEALIDVTSTVGQMKVEPTSGDDGASVDIAKELAESMRAKIKAVTGCEVSIGIAPNIMLARLATRRAKPAGSFHLHQSLFQDLLPTLDIQDLHGFGRAAREKALDKFGTSNLGQLAGRSKAALCDALGKSTGETLYSAIRGVDERNLESDSPRKSVSCDINYGIRFENDGQVETFIHQMSEEVARRLDAIGVKGRSLTLKIMKRDPSAPVEAPKFMGHGQCMTFSKQTALADSDGHATSDPRVIGRVSWRLLRALNIAPQDLRGISIQVQKLDTRTVSAPTPGQARLSFRREPNSTAENTIIEQHPTARASLSELVTAIPEQEAPEREVDLPSFSQVDRSVFEALPEDIRQELEAEYQRRRSAPPPKLESVADEPPPRRSASTISPRGANNRLRILGAGAGASRGQRGRRQQRGRGAAYRGRLSSAPPAPPAQGALRVDPGELAELGIDEEVFAALPVSLQREQLAAARCARVRPSQQPVRPTSPLKPLQRLGGRWAPPKGPHEYVPPPPPPRARFAEVEKPALRSGGAATAVVVAVDGQDVRRAVRAWVERFVGHAPRAEDVGLVRSYLVRCAETDVGAERAVGVMRWWGALLRRRWAVWEHADERDEEAEPGEDVRAEMVGMAWWRAYREVGGGMNEVVRKRFGGTLRFR
ncbi:DNA repair protein [Russula earlei]|uniref:DNA repair protein n=1 Tax=Russula earlei TaxID=71964 RepID=A0ACC0UAT2_9AGAM|nr:DNA repair protein [Russula earlei]